MSHGVLAIIVGALVAYTAAHALMLGRRKRRGMVQTTGTVVRLSQVSKMAPPMLPASQNADLTVSSFGKDYQPVIQFSTPDGRQVQFSPGLQMNGNAMAMFGRKFRVGAQVPVRYQPGDPTNAVAGVSAITVIQCAVLAGGLIALIAGVVSTVG